MNPKYYYDNFVKPNFNEFCNDEGSIRRAFNAVVSLSHMTDNYFNYYKRREDARVARFNKLEDFRVYLSDLTPYFNDVQSMANAYKHLYTNSGRAHVTVESGGAIYVKEATETENDDSIDDEDLTDASCSYVYYLKKDGSSLLVKDALSEVIKKWGDLI
jgi:hypothetical protein